MASMETSSLPQPATGEPRNAITLHILCQTLPPPNRFTIHNVSLSTTIAQLKERIEQAFPGNPRASTQRLIYRGKPLRVEDAVLSAIISIGEEFNGSESIHLVLPPEPPKMEKSPVASGTSQASQIAEELTQSSTQTSGTTTQSGTHPSVAPANAPSAHSFVRPALGSATPPYTTIQQIINNSSPALSGTNNQSPDADGADFSHRVRVMRRHIELIEQQLDHLTLPPMAHIISVRTQLLEIQDARYERRLPVPGVAELVGRIFNAQQRARLLDSAMMQRSSQVNPSESVNASGSVERGAENSPPLYMLSSPTGDQSIIFTPNAINAQSPAVQPTLPTRTAAGDPAAAHQPPNAAAVQNAVRHAMLNQQRRGNNIEHNGLARHMRRIWLFTRLWFFCYLTSAPGTWRRYIFVSLALLASFLSETDIPQQFLRSVIAPAQRHLESLAHAGGPLDPSATATNGAPGLGLWEQIRRLERSIVLLVASLIPGLGERQVQARHAAERAREVAEQERAEQERVQQEAAVAPEHPEQNEQNEQNDESGLPDAAPVVDSGTGDNSGNVRVE
ncbi:unnamed protein product [Penicillium salamii]|uniref:Ubiquitin-like domain-containing protein n=1 Tax=Penicillium salamii TaxID=1612424 RepID=A0A9W4ITL6_9EURO|nr:unnamed protein product [Penicillium salamii]CAG8015680.1 unnamed protein product [Penicillium salamii]CAG8234089.1 unnamed protein product [Penicillium salamii]CAG8361222.1 unnamed protein product [Penicillium salamii]CAG8365444.1 unnamed protein product [Penicillium salamii]